MQIVSKGEKDAIINLLKSQEKIPESVKELVKSQFEFFAYLMTIIEKED